MKKPTFVCGLSILLSIPSVVSAFSPDDFDTAGLPGWASFGSALTQITTDSSGLLECTNIAPVSGTHQGQWTCPGCMPGDPVTLRYVPPDTSLATYIIADIYSCGRTRDIAMRVVDGGGHPCTFYTTSCGSGSCPQNGWDHLYVDTSQCPSLTNIAYVDIFTDDLYGNQVVYIDNVRGSANRPVCDTGVGTCIVYPQGWTCTPTNTPEPIYTSTPTSTNTPCMVGMFTCTFTNTVSYDTPTPTLTSTPTYSPTPTLTPTATPWPITVFPNPIDFQAAPPMSNCCPAEMRTTGCFKFFGIPLGSTMKIYTINLSLVRNFEPSDIRTTQPPICVINGVNINPLANPGTGWLAWQGDNDDRNPVSSGLYMYIVEPPEGDKIIGKMAITRSRNLK